MSLGQTVNQRSRLCGNREAEATALARRALEIHLPTMGLDDAPDDRQSQSSASRGCRLPLLPKPDEHVRYILCRDSGPSIDYQVADRARLHSHTESYLTPTVGKLQCIANEIGQGLENAVTIAPDRRKVGSHADTQIDTLIRCRINEHVGCQHQDCGRVLLA